MRNYPEPLVEVEEEEFALTGEASDTMLIRHAQLADIPAMLQLINDYASKAVMLPCTELELCETLRDFLVAVDISVDNGKLLGCGRLHFYTPHMAELRSVAVAPDAVRGGLGKRITQELLQEARQFGIDVVFAFTYVPGFFEKMGFQPVDRGMLPLKAWKDCLRCPKFQACDEIAVAYMVTPGAEVHMSAMPPAEAPAEGPILFPILGMPRILDRL